MVPIISRARLGRIAVLLAFVLILTGCAKTKITKANFDKIEKDMTVDEVEGILGPGTQSGGDGSLVAAQVGVDVHAGGKQSSIVQYDWESGKSTITVCFRQGKVVQKKNSGL